jgi:protein-disulfide isomerase
MRLTWMTRLSLAATASLLFALLGAPAHAQYSAPPNTGTAFKDTSMLKPPAGAKVALYTFEDLECPACARAYPMIQGAADHYKVPVLRHDFPLKMHLWSFDAAVTARYLQDKVSPKTAEEFRAAVFSSQASIASKEDLNNFTRRWFQSHKLNMPFVMDPSGLFTAEIRADYTLGERIGLTQTPTILVVTQKNWIQVTDPTQLYQTLDTAIAQAGSSTPASKSTAANSKLRHPATPQK